MNIDDKLEHINCCKALILSISKKETLNLNEFVKGINNHQSLRKLSKLIYNDLLMDKQSK